MSEVNQIASADAASSPKADAGDVTRERSVGLGVVDAAKPSSVDIDRLVEQRVEKEIKARKAAKDRLAEERAERERAQTELEEIKRQQAEEQGHYKELYLNEKKSNEELRSDVLRNNVQKAFVAAAAKRGCASPENAWKFADQSKLVYDRETGEVEGVEQQLDVMEQDMSWFFQAKPTPTVNPSVPGGIVQEPKKDLTQMSSKEIKAELAALGKKAAGR